MTLCSGGSLYSFLCVHRGQRKGISLHWGKLAENHTKAQLAGGLGSLCSNRDITFRSAPRNPEKTLIYTLRIGATFQCPREIPKLRRQILVRDHPRRRTTHHALAAAPALPLPRPRRSARVPAPPPSRSRGAVARRRGGRPLVRDASPRDTPISDCCRRYYKALRRRYYKALRRRTARH